MTTITGSISSVELLVKNILLPETKTQKWYCYYGKVGNKMVGVKGIGLRLQLLEIDGARGGTTHGITTQKEFKKQIVEQFNKGIKK